MKHFTVGMHLNALKFQHVIRSNHILDSVAKYPNEFSIYALLNQLLESCDDALNSHPKVEIYKIYSRSETPSSFRALMRWIIILTFQSLIYLSKKCILTLGFLPHIYTCLLLTGGHVHIDLVGKKRRLSLDETW